MRCLGEHPRLAVLPVSSGLESGESENPQPKRDFSSLHPSLSSHPRRGAWVGSTFHPGFQPVLQGYRDFSPPLLFNYIQGSFSAFAIPLIAFRADISSGVNSIGVPAMVRRDGEFIWMLLIPLSILWVPSRFKQGSNFYFVWRVETSRINHTLERNRW